MTGEVFAAMLDDLRSEEGLRLVPYQDSLGFWTLGYGTKLPLTRVEAEHLLEGRAVAAVGALTAALPWVSSLDPVRQRVLFEMAYQMGVGGVLGFHKMLDAVRCGAFDIAANEMLDSAWARSQTPARAGRLAKMMRTGPTV